MKIGNNSGGVLAYILVILLVLAITASVIFSIFSSNLLQARRQESYMESYYLAYSGAYMGFAAIIEDENEILKEIENNNAVYKEENIDFGEGKIDIEASKSSEANYPGWIKIISKGTLDKDGTVVTRTLYIDPENQKNTVWK